MEAGIVARTAALLLACIRASNSFSNKSWLESHNGDSQTWSWINKWVPPVYNGGISPGQKWWRTFLEHRNFMQPMGRLSMNSKFLDYFLLSFFWAGGGGGGEFFHFSFVPTCSLQVPNVFPIASCFDPICFAQSPPLLTYIGGPKGEALHLSIESASIVSTLFCDGPIKLAHCQRKKVGLGRHPQLTKYLGYASCFGVFLILTVLCWEPKGSLRLWIIWNYAEILVQTTFRFGKMSL